MLTITIPSNNVEARRYVIQTVFKNFLGLDCSIKDESSNTTIIRWDDKSIIFKDVFWNAGGISISNLPNVVYSRNVFVSEEDIPILYGDSSLNVDDNIIECGIDFFASIFFMLSRWEEYEVRERWNRPVPSILSVNVVTCTLPTSLISSSVTPRTSLLPRMVRPAS